MHGPNPVLLAYKKLFEALGMQEMQNQALYSMCFTSSFSWQMEWIKWVLQRWKDIRQGEGKDDTQEHYNSGLSLMNKFNNMQIGYS